MDRDEIAGLEEIMRLHDEAFAHFQRCPGAGWKSSEGAVEVYFGNYWERAEGRGLRVGVYSYALGPSRMHYFDSVREAVDAVRGWHAEEMAHTDHSECG